VQDEGVKPALAVLPLLAVAACSGGSSATAGRASYLEKAEAICTEAIAEQKALKTPATATELSPYVDAIVRLADETTTDLLRVPAPGKDKAALDRHVFTPLHGQLLSLRTYADKVRAAARSKDQIALVKLLSNPPSRTAVDLAWMRAYGFRSCVEAADTTS
jgi:hypothetical protein